MSVGKRIRALRVAAGLRQGELAKLAGMAQSTLSDLERGDSILPRGDSLTGIAKALKVSADWLLSGLGTPVAPVTPSIEESELIAIFRDMVPGNKAALIAAARAMLESQPEPTPASPLKRKTSHKQ